MLETVDAIDVPQTWGIVDIIKQTISLMVLYIQYTTCGSEQHAWGLEILTIVHSCNHTIKIRTPTHRLEKHKFVGDMSSPREPGCTSSRAHDRTRSSSVFYNALLTLFIATLLLSVSPSV